MKSSHKLTATIAYVPLVGLLYVVLFCKDDEFAIYHAKQCLFLTVVAVLAPLLWGIVGWLLTLIPFVGPILAAASFALVILSYIFLIVAWLMGIVYTVQERMEPLPVIGDWGLRFFPKG